MLWLLAHPFIAYGGHLETGVILAPVFVCRMTTSLLPCALAEVGDVVVAGQSAIPYLQDAHLQIIHFCPRRACTSQLP